jgi:serine/threonine protein phosphatase PrpC
MLSEVAEISFLGNRQENQDRVKVVESGATTLLIAIDGMGGHADGARAAELAVETLEKFFLAETHPIFDPQGFLHLAIGRAHAAVAELGADISIEARPRATCALCLIQDDAAYWGHVGDSRIYHLRNSKISEHSRDHSHVEVLLYDGMITPEELATHPMRNYVECCLGGDAELPRMSITGKKPMRNGDVMLVCSDGFWGPILPEQLAGLSVTDGSLQEKLQSIGGLATRTAAPHSDNTSAAALSLFAPE